MGRMSKIRVAFDAKDDSSRQRRLEGRSAKTTSTSTHTDDSSSWSTHQIVQVSSLHRKKTTFCRNFTLEDLELSKVFHIFATSKDIHTHSFTTFIHTNNRVFFETIFGRDCRLHWWSRCKTLPRAISYEVRSPQIFSLWVVHQQRAIQWRWQKTRDERLEHFEA